MGIEPRRDDMTRGATRRDVGRVMRRLGRAVDRMDQPAVEKIADAQAADPFQVLVATMLSAQTKDAVTLDASTRLFRKARTARSVARMPVQTLERLIYPVSFYRHKAKHVKETCRRLLARFGGEVPTTMDALLTLPGVGRKTANLVLIVAHRSEANICVDTHVHRIANRLGWVSTRTPDETEQALYGAAHRRWWSSINRYLVTWARTSAGRCTRGAGPAR